MHGRVGRRDDRFSSRLGWWDCDLVDADAGGDLFARLLPRTARWAALKAARDGGSSSQSGCSILDPPFLSPSQPPARVEPLSPSRYKVQFTASAELNEKLERAVALMCHRNPSGDLAVVFELALDDLLETLDKETRGKAARKNRAPRSSLHCAAFGLLNLKPEPAAPST